MRFFLHLPVVCALLCTVVTAQAQPIVVTDSHHPVTNIPEGSRVNRTEDAVSTAAHRVDAPSARPEGSTATAPSTRPDVEVPGHAPEGILSNTGTIWDDIHRVSGMSNYPGTNLPRAYTTTIEGR